MERHDHAAPLRRRRGRLVQQGGDGAAVADGNFDVGFGDAVHGGRHVDAGDEVGVGDGEEAHVGDGDGPGVAEAGEGVRRRVAELGGRKG